MAAKIKNHPKLATSRRSHKPKTVSHKTFKKVYWPYIPVIIVLGALITLGSQAGAISSIINHPDGKVLSYATSMSIGGLLTSTNSARSQNGVGGLNLNDKLDAAAQAKANDMASRNYWSHNTPEGSPPWVFVSNQGYSYQKLGENLAAGFSDEQSTINGWMASQPHRENLLDPAFVDVGFGFANNPDYTSAGGGPMTIVVAFYGKPQVLGQQTTTAPAAAAPKASSAPPSPSPAASAPTPSSNTPSAPPASEVATPSKTPPATTQNAINSRSLAKKTSRAQLALGGLPWSNFGTTLAVIGAVVAVGLWFSRHVLAFRRVLIKSERFVIKHPMMDLGLLAIAALSFLLTQTAGLIQ